MRLGVGERNCLFSALSPTYTSTVSWVLGWFSHGLVTLMRHVDIPRPVCGVMWLWSSCDAGLGAVGLVCHSKTTWWPKLDWSAWSWGTWVGASALSASAELCVGQQLIQELVNSWPTAAPTTSPLLTHAPRHVQEGPRLIIT